MRRIVFLLLLPALTLLSGAGPSTPVRVIFSPAIPAKGDFIIVRISPCDPGRKYSMVLKTPARLVFPVPEVDGRQATGYLALPLQSSDTVRFEVMAGNLSVATGRLRLVPAPGQTGMTQKISVNSKYVEPPAGEYPRIERDVRTMKTVHAFYTNVRFFGNDPVFPVLEGRLGSPFGEQRVLNGGRASIHYGVDIRSNRNKVIVSLHPGRVIFTGNLFYSGNTVVVAHGYGLMSQYLHLSRISVREGEFVKAGQQLGIMGMTGRATGPHLHLSCYLMGVQFNPMSLFNKAIRQ